MRERGVVPALLWLNGISGVAGVWGAFTVASLSAFNLSISSLTNKCGAGQCEVISRPGRQQLLRGFKAVSAARIFDGDPVGGDRLCRDGEFGTVAGTI